MFLCLCKLALIAALVTLLTVLVMLLTVFLRAEVTKLDARSSFYNGAVQAGYNSDSVLADAYFKGIRGAINCDDGLLAMLKNGALN
ncbi:glycosyl hydrolase family 92 [Colletotrichum higginsianum]|nr:glycosyl hydrolase family 92 [Colletotrichum higginsianum]